MNAGDQVWTDGEITVRYYAWWDYRCWPPKLVTPDFEAIKRGWRPIPNASRALAEGEKG